MSGPSKPDYYKILQVDSQADPVVIQGAYRALLKSAGMHPDLGGSQEAAQAITGAYSVLSDPEARRAYDLEQVETPRDVRVVAVPQYIFICPACRGRNMLRDSEELPASRCGNCGRPLWRQDRLATKGDVAGAYRLGLYLFEKRLYDRALQEMRSLVRAQPRNPLFRYWLGRTLYQKRNFKEARTEFKAAANQESKQFHFHFWWGQANQALKDYPDAVKGYAKAVRLRPGHLPTLMRLAACLAYLRKYGKAVTTLREAVRRHDLHAEPRIRLGLYLLADGKAEEATEMFKQADSIAPGNPLVQKYIEGAQGAPQS